MSDFCLRKHDFFTVWLAEIMNPILAILAIQMTFCNCYTNSLGGCQKMILKYVYIFLAPSILAGAQTCLWVTGLIQINVSFIANSILKSILEF